MWTSFFKHSKNTKFCVANNQKSCGFINFSTYGISLFFQTFEQSNHIASEVKSIKSRFEKVTILKLMNEPINLRWNQNVLEFEGLRKWICWTFLSSLNVIEIPKKP